MSGDLSHAAGKRAAAEAAVAEVEPGMLVGLGTGSTAAYAIAALGRRVGGGLTIRAVATSLRTAAAAAAAGLPLIDMAGVAAVDLCIDGVDEIDPALRAIKGGGGAMLREKVVATAARRNVAIADAAKRVARLGAAPVPIELLPFAEAFVTRAVRALGGEPELRLAGAAPAISDSDHRILDCRFAAIADPAALAAELSAVPGVLGHGLFVSEIDAVYVGTGTAVERIERAG